MPRLVHFEMNVKDVHKAISFYEEVFGWRFQKWDGPMDYWFIMTGDENEPGIDGGLGYAEEDLPKVINTIDVDDIDDVIKKIESKGGEIVRPKHAVPRVGWLAYFKDSEGVISGIMQNDPTAI
ncbi:MAG: VOC family protein [Candidatus Lokiarchaeota archaeon]|nr:VOC family protein [Candidatus Lokiarchaeota archaeon]